MVETTIKEGYGSGSLTSQDSTYSSTRNGSGTLISSLYGGNVGQRGVATHYECIHLYLNFDTSVLNGVTPDSVSFQVYSYSLPIISGSGTSNFDVVMVSWDFGTTVGLGNWLDPTTASGLTELGELNTADWVEDEYQSFTLNGNALLNAINPNGITKIVLLSRNWLDNNSVGSVSEERVAISRSDNEIDPKLVINYTPPITSINAEESVATASVGIPTISAVFNTTISGEITNANVVSELPSITSQQVVNIDSEEGIASSLAGIPIIISDIEGVVEPPTATATSFAIFPDHSHDYVIDSEEATATNDALLPVVSTEVGVSVSAEEATASVSGLIPTLSAIARRGIINAGQSISKIIITGGTAIRNKYGSGSRRIN